MGNVVDALIQAYRTRTNKRCNCVNIHVRIRALYMKRLNCAQSNFAWHNVTSGMAPLGMRRAAIRLRVLAIRDRDSSARRADRTPSAKLTGSGRDLA